MKIRKLQLKNIGVFDDEKIKFQSCPAEDKAEIHIFTGQNGSGKTTILQALANLFKIQENKPLDKTEGVFINDFHSSFYKRIRENVSSHLGFEIQHSNHKATYNLDCLLSNRARLVFFQQKERLNEIDIILTNYADLIGLKILPLSTKTAFASFAYSGYRRIKDEKINLFDEVEENPLHQALDFVKDENSKFTINQWLGRSLSKRALALEDNNKEAKQYTRNVQNLEKAIVEIVGYDIRFKLKTDLSLVLIKDDLELDFDVLPDGLKSLISWIGDLLMRLDSLKWQDDLPIFEKNLILFLDEIEVHLHPAWQRKVLPVVQKLFKNAQIFVSTHSPFVVNSVDDAWVYELELENGKAKVAEKSLTKTAYSYQTILREIFDIDERFGDGSGEEGTQIQLNDFYKQRDEILNSNGKSKINKKKFLEFAANLASQSAELQSLVFLELARLSNEKGEPYEI